MISHSRHHAAPIFLPNTAECFQNAIKLKEQSASAHFGLILSRPPIDLEKRIEKDNEATSRLVKFLDVNINEKGDKETAMAVMSCIKP